MLTRRPESAVTGGLALALASLVALASTTATGTSAGLDLLWHQQQNGKGSPVVHESTAFFMSKEHDVFALDIENGRTIWRQPTGETGDALSGSALTISGPVVVAGDYNLVAFDRVSGALRWRFVPADVRVETTPALMTGTATYFACTEASDGRVELSRQ